MSWPARGRTPRRQMPRHAILGGWKGLRRQRSTSHSFGRCGREAPGRRQGLDATDCGRRHFGIGHSIVMAVPAHRPGEGGSMPARVASMPGAAHRLSQGQSIRSGYGMRGRSWTEAQMICAVDPIVAPDGGSIQVRLASDRHGVQDQLRKRSDAARGSGLRGSDAHPEQPPKSLAKSW
jgi:hypothetical protein